MVLTLVESILILDLLLVDHLQVINHLVERDPTMNLEEVHNNNLHLGIIKIKDNRTKRKEMIQGLSINCIRAMEM
jgi:hypothetical protein